jgi:hypothetical protein
MSISRSSEVPSSHDDDEKVNLFLSENKDDSPFRPSQDAKPVDILWGLRVIEEGKPSRTFYKDQPWKGINTFLSGSDNHEDEEEEVPAVIMFFTEAVVIDKTNKSANSIFTWRNEPIDFQFGDDAELIRTYLPVLRLVSKNLIKIMESLLDYYPDHLEHFHDYHPKQGNFQELMHYYPELKAYFNTYIQSLPKDQPLDPRLDIGICGDEEIAGRIQDHLDFGALDVKVAPCDETTAYDLAVLLRLLASTYQTRVAPTMISRLLSPEPLIKYENLWLLMRPGTLVYVQKSAFEESNHRRAHVSHPEDDWLSEAKDRSAYIVSSSYFEKHKRATDGYEGVDRFLVELWSIQIDEPEGKFLERVGHQAIIPRFEGSRAMKTLQVVPSDVHDKFDGGELRRRLERRGKKYLSIVREPAAHREYEDPRSGYNGQIIIDPEAYMQNSLKAEVRRETVILRERKEFVFADGGGGKKFRGFTDFPLSNSETFSRINEVYVLLPSTIQGLGLKTKKWMVFEIDNISERAPVPSPNQLENDLVLISDADKQSLRTVLPKGEKFVGDSSDFVQGKGEGKIFLLYGPPGTGKTLTVECVANDTRRPLLSLTAQDVRMEYGHDIEANLRQWFILAAKWDAILLIDEADLFLEQRREGSLERNSLSTVFLRTMEYYEGVLFLTTNRAGHIDDSFISRITCPIAYHPLSLETKSKIVKKFISRYEETGTIEIQERAESYLIEHCAELNGRQLRNILQNAVAIAEVQQRSELSLAHQSSRAGQQLPAVKVVSVKWHQVKAAVERQANFMSYMNKLKGKDEYTRARSKQDYLSAPPTPQGRGD